jgi:hypothetical protein
MPDQSLDAERVADTVGLLCRRIQHRFPESGLLDVAREVARIAAHTKQRTAWIARPIFGLRIALGLLLALIAAGLAVTFSSVKVVAAEEFKLAEFVQMLEAGINDVVLIGAAVFFLGTLETRIKRRRALAAVRELRAVAHIIDMHQLTKDPQWILGSGEESGVLPPHTMSRFELSRYLDYCSELLALTGKIGALYIQRFDDDVALAAVNEVESLTTGLSRKIWQKLMILYAAGAQAPPEPAAQEDLQTPA